jgi:hypothetical protein
MSIRLLLCLLLMCASFQLAAREIRMASANGDGGGTCQDEALGRDGDASAAAVPAAKPARHVVKPVKARAPVAGRGGGGDNLGDIRPPRWHSFLPGMFR